MLTEVIIGSGHRKCTEQIAALRVLPYSFRGPMPSRA